MQDKFGPDKVFDNAGEQISMTVQHRRCTYDVP